MSRLKRTAHAIARVRHLTFKSRHHRNPMSQSQPDNPLHGITLERILTELVEGMGWETMGRKIAIRCFTHDPSIPSSLRFLRRTPWAREQVEALYLRHKHG